MSVSFIYEVYMFLFLRTCLFCNINISSGVIYVTFPGIIYNLYTLIKPLDKNFIPYHSKQDDAYNQTTIAETHIIHQGLTVFMNNCRTNISKTIYHFAKLGICTRYLGLLYKLQVLCGYGLGNYDESL